MKLIGYAELEARYGIKRATAASYVHRKLIPHIKVGPRNTLFDEEEILRWLDERRVPAVSGGIQ